MCESVENAIVENEKKNETQAYQPLRSHILRAYITRRKEGRLSKGCRRTLWKVSSVSCNGGTTQNLSFFGILKANDTKLCKLSSHKNPF